MLLRSSSLSEGLPVLPVRRNTRSWEGAEPGHLTQIGQRDIFIIEHHAEHINLQEGRGNTVVFRMAFPRKSLVIPRSCSTPWTPLSWTWLNTHLARVNELLFCFACACSFFLHPLDCLQLSPGVFSGNGSVEHSCQLELNRDGHRSAYVRIFFINWTLLLLIKVDLVSNFLCPFPEQCFHVSLYRRNCT